MTTKGSIQQGWSDGPARETGTCRLDVLLKPTWIERVGYRYDVILDGETIVRQSRDPEHDAARVLHARGHRGKFRTIDFTTGKPRMILDIEKAAKLKVVERDRDGLSIEAYHPMSDENRNGLRGPPTTHPGRLFVGRVAFDTGQALPAAGGERWGEAADNGASLHRAHQGRLVPAEVAPDAGDAEKAAGGKTAARRRRSHQDAIDGDASVIPPEPDADAGVRLESEEA